MMQKLLTDTGWILPLLVIFASLLPMRVFLTMVHEAGHAIAIALLTKNKVTVFLGSYGDKQKSRKIILGNFEIWLKLNLLKLRGGMCSYDAEEATLRQQFIITLAGPIASLLLSLILLFVLLFFNLDSLWRPFFQIFMAWSVLDFFRNIFGSNKAFNLENGTLIYNDGARLRKLGELAKSPPEYFEAMEFFDNKKYDESVLLLEDLIRSGTKNPGIYRLAIDAHLQLKNYKLAEMLQRQQIAKIGNINTHDRVAMAKIKTALYGHEEGIAYISHLLQLYGENILLMNELGYSLIEIGKAEDALHYFDKVIKVNNLNGAAYTNRAYAYLKLGNMDKAQPDIETSLQLDAANPLAWRNSGIYNFEMWRYETAIEHFEKAMEIDPKTPLVNYYLLETSRKMEDWKEIQKKRKY
jgi:tetratricopeptide (TPR) repeat protein